jgi:quercetin dioxygenase-like cupin family protein
MRLARIAWEESGSPSGEDLRERLAAEGFESFEWADAPGADYSPHAHDHDESLWVIDGDIVFSVAGVDYRLGPGDRLMLPKGTVHTARAGGAGARYLIGERR